MITVELNQEQSRKVTVDHIARTLIIMKQYLDDSQIVKYKFMLREFASLLELEDIAKKFDRAWPTEVTWDGAK